VFTARYALSLYITQITFVFKRLIVPPKLVAGTEIRLWAGRSGVQIPASQKINLFPKTCRPTSLVPTQPPLQCVQVFPKTKPGHEVEHSPPRNAEVKNDWRHTSTPPICLHGVAVTTAGFSAHPTIVNSHLFY
jgi:hypothetical protein